MKKKLLSLCLNIALQNNSKHPEFGFYHHFSFVIQDNAICDWGVNRKREPMQYLGYQTHTKMHSEVDAYFKARGLLDKGKNFDVINIRLTKTNKIVRSDPCPCCFSFLRKAGARKIFFTTSLGNFASMNF
jgi:tRNA(Arg) A34 adenosine deaminase TadA